MRGALRALLRGIADLPEPTHQQRLDEKAVVGALVSHDRRVASACSTRRLTSLRIRAPAIMRSGSLRSAFGFLARLRRRVTPGTPAGGSRVSATGPAGGGAGAPSRRTSSTTGYSSSESHPKRLREGLLVTPLPHRAPRAGPVS